MIREQKQTNTGRRAKSSQIIGKRLALSVPTYGSGKLALAELKELEGEAGYNGKDTKDHKHDYYNCYKLRLRAIKHNRTTLISCEKNMPSRSMLAKNGIEYN